MSVRHALLALLSEGPKYGLQLREEFEARTGEVWPLNVGQVYTTLQRLERDGLVESDGDGQDGPQKGFRITAAGTEELTGWLRTPSDMSSPPRDELVMKVLVALRVPGTDVREVIQVHRRYLVELMQQWTRIKETEAESDMSLALVVDAELFRLDAVVRWLDAADGRIKRAAADPIQAETDYGDDTGRAERAAQELEQEDERAGNAARVAYLRRGGRRGARAARHRPDGRRGRDGGRDGAERIGEVHAADHRRQPGGSQQRRGARLRGGADDAVAQRQGAAAAPLDRLRVPGFQPAARADGGGERLAAARARRRAGAGRPAWPG